jgi:hypothetical protein
MNVRAHSLKAELLAMAILKRFSRPVKNLEQQLRAAPVELEIAQLVKALR